MPPPITPWPPLITGERRPYWVTIRDIVLTSLVWMFLAWLLRDLIYLVYDFLRPPRFQLTIAPPDPGALWERLQYFVMLAALLIAWLALSAVLDRRRLLADERVLQPSPLTIGEEAHLAGVDEKTMADARKLKVTSVLFRSDGTIAGFEDKGEYKERMEV